MVLRLSFWTDWLDAIANWISSNGWNDFPTSVGVLTIIALLIAIFSTTISRLLTDVDALRDSMRKVNDWNQRRKKAMQTADKKLWLSVKRDEERIKKMQSSMMFKRMKPMLFTTVPFFIVFAILRRAYPIGEFGHYYAWLPFNLGNFPWLGTPWFGTTNWNGHIYSKASFTLWYFIVAFAFGSIISRIFGVTPSGATTSKQKQKPETKRTPTSVTREKLAKSKTAAKSTSKK